MLIAIIAHKLSNNNCASGKKFTPFQPQSVPKMFRCSPPERPTIVSKFCAEIAADFRRLFNDAFVLDWQSLHQFPDTVAEFGEKKWGKKERKGKKWQDKEEKRDGLRRTGCPQWFLKVANAPWYRSVRHGRTDGGHNVVSWRRRADAGISAWNTNANATTTTTMGNFADSRTDEVRGVSRKVVLNPLLSRNFVNR